MLKLGDGYMGLPLYHSLFSYKFENFHNKNIFSMNISSQSSYHNTLKETGI